MPQTDEQRAAEIEKAERDKRLFGTGYLKVTAEGLKHIPAEQVYFKAPLWPGPEGEVVNPHVQIHEPLCNWPGCGARAEVGAVRCRGHRARDSQIYW